jgi:adenosine kinase
VDTTYARVISGVYTASFFANTDRSNAQIASFYPGAMAYASELSLYEVKDHRPDLVVISPNDPEAMKHYVVECQAMELPYIYDPSQQIVRLTPDEVRRGIEGALAVFVNDYEFALIQKMTGLTTAGILERALFLVVTCGDKGATVYSHEGEFHIPIVPPDKIADPTGVGDAFRGGFITAYGYRLDWKTCARVGVLAATYCLENQGPQGHHYTPGDFVTRFRRYFKDEGQLDVFLK